MKILLTNDDGIDAPGINVLAEVLEGAGHDIIVVAPSKEQSATSHSITLHEPLRIIERDERHFAVTGSPADCMILAFRVILKDSVDLVISGINGGQNMGEDILYSGTVAAALEAMFIGNKAIALSIASHQDQKFETAARYMRQFIDEGITDLIEGRMALNINVPNVDYDDVKGVKVSNIGHRKYEDFVKEQKDPRGRKIYWIGGAKALWEDKENSDFKIVNDNHISITPISPNFTMDSMFTPVFEWLENRK